MPRALALVALACLSSSVVARITPPNEYLGHEVGERYMLANYAQYTGYLQLLAKQSNRIRIVSIGKSEEGRDQWMAVISDPANLRSLERIRQTNQRIALGVEGADREIDRAKAVVWIDGGLHSTETLGHQQLFEQAYQLVSRNDEENRRILRECVVLLVHANPDGMDLVSNWYMRREKKEERSLAGLPVLYQKYAGHDNNRDFYANNLAETRNMNRVLYHDWIPQIVYNHHQSSPRGTIMFLPPFRSPFNHHMDPIVQVGTDLVGLHMHQRLIAEGRGGTVMRNGAGFSTWWNGGLRTTTYFHNMIGILSETWGSPGGDTITFLKERQVPTTDLPKPIDPRFWTLRDSLPYEIGANYAILDYASRFRTRLLGNMHRAARNSIEAGGRDSWTRYPSRIERFGPEAITRPELRDARAYILPARPRDPGSQRWFLERLRHAGVEIQELTAPLELGGKTYERGSILISAAQAFRPHVLDMFEPQDHPNDFQYPGGPPIPPYDAAGYTPAFTMGIEFDRILDTLPRVTTRPVVNPATTPGAAFDDIDSYASMPGRMKVGLWDTYGGSMPSGWTRFTLERFKWPFEVVFAPELDAGNLRARFDALLFVGSAIPAQERAAAPNPLATDPTVPEVFRRRLGTVSIARTIPMIKQFLEEGGTVLAVGDNAANLARHLDLPVENALAGVRSTEFFIPGSVLRVQVNRHALTRGLGGSMDVIFDDSPAFRVKEGATAVATYADDKPLRSGWAWGQERLKGLAAVVEVPVGRGRVILYGPEVLYRAQPSASMKLVFNALVPGS